MKSVAPIVDYIAEVRSQLSTGHALEHAYRPGLQKLLNSLDDAIAVNDPKHSDHGAPDFILLRESNQDLVLGYGEAKDLTKSLDKVEQSEQFQRYSGYEKLFITNYLDFRFYENGIQIAEVSIAKLDKNELTLIPQNFSKLQDHLNYFIESAPAQIRSGRELARIMGAKARRIRDEVEAIVSHGDSEQERLRKTMKKMLVHDLTKSKFADLYAQTLVYGLFVARYNDPTPESFSREEARELVPIANPFLRTFFDHIAGANFERKLRRTVDELCQVFEVTDLVGIFERYTSSKSGHSKDPVIYFYEDFLNTYDPTLRKDMGAFYTPLPVVHFIVKMIHHALIDYFDAPLGLADTSKRTVEIDDGQARKYRDPETGGTKRTTKQTLEYHRIQILDPAVGTVTFLNETIKSVHEILSEHGQTGMWNSYVSNSLLPRIHGFEYMMAPYTIAHLKLGLTLSELGYREDWNTRLGIYLTNSLEPGIPQPTDLFSLIGLSEAISSEARLAAVVKNEKPLLVVLGNPPYLGESNNVTEYAEALTDRYKCEPGSDQRLQEANYKWLRNDYVKFLAMAQQKIETLGEGIIGMITPNSYLSQPTFRGMRYSLLKTFDRMYILDLGGSLHSRDTDSAGRADQNVFDIETGVSILIAVKSPKIQRKQAEVLLHRIRGDRISKFKFLEKAKTPWTEVTPRHPMYAFRIHSENSVSKIYAEAIPIKELFPLNSLGILTKRDKLAVGLNHQDLAQKLTRFFAAHRSDFEACEEFGLKVKDKDKWNAQEVRKKYSADDLTSFFEKVHYRPFDHRVVVYNNDLVARPNRRVLDPLKHDNLGLFVGRQGQAVKDMEWNLSFITNLMSDQNIFGRGGGTVFPLYADSYSEEKIVNINQEKRRQLLSYVNRDVSPEELFYYVYGVLNSKQYREAFADFLKDDFPRIPKPRNDEEFDLFCAFGEKLAALHTENEPVAIATSFPISGSNVVENVKLDGERLFINQEQYIEGVSAEVWNFYIGGYSVVQKWLKERKNRSLTYEELLHLQTIISILQQSSELKKTLFDTQISWTRGGLNNETKTKPFTSQP